MSEASIPIIIILYSDAAFKDIAMNLNELFDNSIFPVGGENVDFAKYFDGKS